jgi:P27 family predicted phage terminase small subunit
MARGRPPKPHERMRATARDATHKADGREIVPAQYKLAAATEIPVAPDMLMDRGQSEWEKIWSAGYWLSPDQDYHWVAIIATAYDEIEMYRAVIADEGLTAVGIRGTTIAHPLIAEIRKAQQVIMKALSQLGFSPSDRARLSLAEVQLKNARTSLNDKLKAKG